jgi:transcriptional regulator with XRE-family HTH domain
MATKEKSQARKILEKYTTGPLTLGRFIASIRKGEEMKLERFSKKLKISKSHLSDIENGRKFVSAELAAQYAKKLGYSEKQFIRLALQDILNRQGLEKYHVIIQAA